MLKKTAIALLLVTLAGCNSSSNGGKSTSTSADTDASAGVASSGPAGKDFYKGRNVTYIVATNAGGGYDTYARMIGKYMEKYLGADNVIIRNVPGAGHIVGANTLWESKPDGLTIGTFNAGLIYGQLVGTKSMQFDLAKFEWIGKAEGEPRAVIVSKQCDIQSMQDLLAADKPVKFSSAGIGSASYVDAELLAEAFDLNIDVLTGYNGTEGEMAMMRGEICAQLGSASSFEDFIKSGDAHYILTIGGKIEGVPQASEFVKSDKSKRIVSLIDAIAQLGRVTAAPPGTPPERVADLRAAYQSALEDPGLIAQAKKLGLPLEPAYGEEVHKLVVAALDQSPSTVKIIAAAVNGGKASAAAGKPDRDARIAALPAASRLQPVGARLAVR